MHRFDKKVQISIEVYAWDAQDRVDLNQPSLVAAFLVELNLSISLISGAIDPKFSLSMVLQIFFPKVFCNQQKLSKSNYLDKAKVLFRLYIV